MGSLIVLGVTAACSSGGTFSGNGDGGHVPASGGTTPQYPPASKGTGFTVPAYLTKTYTFTVTSGN